MSYFEFTTTIINIEFVKMYSTGGGKRGSGGKTYDHLIKLIIIGDSHVGKSCILLRFSEGNIPLTHMPTIGKPCLSFV
jgi:GTPase SAR1 family protein